MNSVCKLFTPGPTEIPPEVQAALAEPIIHHRTEAFSALFRETRLALQQVFQTQSDVLVLAATGTGGMEAAVCNFFSPGDTVIAINSGKFGKRWGDIASCYGLQVIEICYSPGVPACPAELAEKLKANPKTKGVFLTASETSTATYHPVDQLAEVVRSHSEALVIVDGITAVGIHDMRPDEWGFDVVVAGSQKGFMLPPGLTFLSVNERAFKQAESSSLPKYYFDLLKERKNQQKDTTAYSPAVTLVRGCHAACTLMLKEGLSNVFERHRSLMNSVHVSAEALGLQLIAKQTPSHCLTAIGIPDEIGADRVRKHLLQNYNMMLAGGQDELKGKIIRIAHFGALTHQDISDCMIALEETLQALGVQVSSGTVRNAIPTTP